MGIALASDDWIQICNIGEELRTIDSQTLENYKNTAWMYLMYVYSLNMLDRCDNIEKIINKGLYYVEHTYKPTDREYYELKFQYIISKLNKDEKDEAICILNEIKKDNASRGNHIVDKDIHRTEQHILKYSIHPYSNKKEFVEKFSKMVIEVSTWTGALSYTKTKNAWESLISLAQDFIENSYFDKNNVSDEEVWTQFMAWYGVLINGFGRGFNIPERAEYAYNYVLASKNFLDWHSAINNRIETKWDLLLDCMSSDEIAIEFIPHTDEAIVISHDFKRPQIIEIDSLIINGITEYNKEDPLTISKFYQQDSPLTDLIRILEPFFKKSKRIYISGSNHFAQFNYGAVPYNKKTLDDYFEIIPMISTADILNNKLKKSKKKIEEIYMYGGIDYENSGCFKTDLKDNKSSWVYLSQIPSELRKGYDYLPYTKMEVDSIASLCYKYNLIPYKFCGQDANESNLKKADYPKSAVLHIATHSFLLPSYSFDALSQHSKRNKVSRLGTVLSNTGLLFSGCNKFLRKGFSESEDGILTAKEIVQLDLSNIGLVVLSSCSSGLGDINNVNGVVYGLSHAFRTAGCHQIMISLWDVPDYTTSLFMRAFYDKLLQGFSTRESLKSAQSFMVSIGYGDPYYWAAFVILD